MYTDGEKIGKADRDKLKSHVPVVFLEVGLWLKGHDVTLKFDAIFCRGRAAQLAEHSRKVLLCFEAAGYSDIQNTRLGRA